MSTPIVAPVVIAHPSTARDHHRNAATAPNGTAQPSPFRVQSSRFTRHNYCLALW
jgi:hypothetical protein